MVGGDNVLFLAAELEGFDVELEFLLGTEEEFVLIDEFLGLAVLEDPNIPVIQPIHFIGED